MLDHLSTRLLTLLQFTRMALVFTALSNTFCTLFLAARRAAGPAGSVYEHLNPHLVLATACISIGLYGYGMALNDIIDRRRDRRIAAHRPLPSGRLPLPVAIAICAFLALLAALGGFLWYRHGANPSDTLLLLVWTAILITVYDLAGKYLVALGLLLLGLIRLGHALIPSPEPPLLWHPLLLFTHVSLLSAVAYFWEEKRPAVTRIHAVVLLGGVVGVNAAMILTDHLSPAADPATLRPTPHLILPFALAAAFPLVALLIWRRRTGSHQAGQTLMLTGLLWLILYDSAFAGIYAGVPYAVALLALLPLSYLMVRVMRWWSRVLALTQPPEFKRVRPGQEINS